MSAIAIRTTAWDALSEPQRLGLVSAAELPTLGEPAVMVDDQAVQWRVHDDPRISEDQVAIVAALVENPELIPLPEPVEEAPDV